MVERVQCRQVTFVANLHLLRGWKPNCSQTFSGWKTRLSSSGFSWSGEGLPGALLEELLQRKTPDADEPKGGREGVGGGRYPFSR